jgi:5-methylcytosine-specific restriction protein A
MAMARTKSLRKQKALLRRQDVRSPRLMPSPSGRQFRALMFWRHLFKFISRKVHAMSAYGRPVRDWYYTHRWQRRSKAQLAEHPLCVRCASKGKVTVARIADHVKRHNGVWNEFWLGELQSLCRNCHESSKKYEEQRGFQNDIGADGWPIDPKHPTYKIEGN